MKDALNCLVLLLSSSWPRRALCPGLALCCPSLGRAPELCQLCGGAAWLLLLSSSCPRPMNGLCGWALCPGLVLNSVWLGFVSRPCPPELCPLGRTPELLLCPGLVLLSSVNSVAGLSAWALWLDSVSRPCPPLVLLLAAPEPCQRAPRLSSRRALCPFSWPRR